MSAEEARDFPRVKLSNRMLRMIARACRMSGQQPYLHTVPGRDFSVIYNDKGYWNPLDLTRHDVYDILTNVDHHFTTHTLTETESQDDYEQTVITSQIKVTATLWKGAARYTSVISGTRQDVHYSLCMAVLNAAASLDEHLNPTEAVYLPD